MTCKTISQMLSVVTLLALGACSSNDSGASSATVYGESHQGEATWYHATGKGNCSFDASQDLMVAAINNKDYGDAAMCGAYLSVAGPKGTVIVRIVDRCPGCKDGGLDLSKEAFAKIAHMHDGRIPITWQVVGPQLSGPVTYRYMDGTSRYWTAIQVRNHRWPIAAFEIKPQGSDKWLSVQRRAYNYFVYPKAIAAGTLQVRITSVTGVTLEDHLPEPKGGLLIKGKAQF